MKIIMMMAITLDGKIAKNSNHFPNWTSKEDKKFFWETSKKHGVIMMGKNTFDTLPSPLPNRLNVVFSPEDTNPELENVKWVKGELKPILEELEKEGHESALLGGGTFLNSLFLKEQLIDEVLLTIEPKIFGNGLSLFEGDFDFNLKLLETKKINDNSIVVRYKIVY